MTFVADENFPRPALEALRKAGWDVFSVAEERPGISDEEVTEYHDGRGYRRGRIVSSGIWSACVVSDVRGSSSNGMFERYQYDAERTAVCSSRRQVVRRIEPAT